MEKIEDITIKGLLSLNADLEVYTQRLKANKHNEDINIFLNRLKKDSQSLLKLYPVEKIKDINEKLIVKDI